MDRYIIRCEEGVVVLSRDDWEQWTRYASAEAVATAARQLALLANRLNHADITADVAAEIAGTIQAVVCDCGCYLDDHELFHEAEE